jgi:hypothetical protein
MEITTGRQGIFQYFLKCSRGWLLAVEIGAHTHHAQIARRANLPHGDGDCHRPQIRTIIRTSRTHERGASRSSRTLGAGCGGRVSCARRTQANADGEVVWSWRSDAGAKVAGLNESDDRRWQPSMVTEESPKETVKTIAQGMPVDLAEPVVTAACFFVAGGPWVRPSPGIPCALFFKRAV